MMAGALDSDAVRDDLHQGDVLVPMATLRRWHDALDGYSAADVPDTVAARAEIAATIAGAGTGSDRPCTGCGNTPTSAWCTQCAQQDLPL